jgi:hypothetical protein
MDTRMALSSRASTGPRFPPQIPGEAGPRSPERPGDLDAALLLRIKAEFKEMRGFSPTLTQAARLFQVPVGECSRVLDALSEQGFLQRAADGTYRLL